MALDAGGVVKLIGQLKKLPGPQFTTGGTYLGSQFDRGRTMRSVLSVP